MKTINPALYQQTGQFFLFDFRFTVKLLIILDPRAYWLNVSKIGLEKMQKIARVQRLTCRESFSPSFSGKR